MIIAVTLVIVLVGLGIIGAILETRKAEPAPAPPILMPEASYSCHRPEVRLERELDVLRADYARLAEHAARPIIPARPMVPDTPTQPIYRAPATRVPDGDSVPSTANPAPWNMPSLDDVPGELREVLDSTDTTINVTDKISFDLDKVPHWLIAGATGMGKSNLINVILAQLVRRDPNHWKIAMVDPKRVELQPWAHIPHKWGEVARTVNETAELLEQLTDEMEARYRVMEAEGIRKVGDTMPRIVVVVDEMADLMLQARKVIEPALTRLAQLGRAAGIYLLTATQRPSTDVITGVLKGNLPGRIAMRVASGVDSRVILDRGGAENLRKAGDLIVAGPVESETGRAPYLSDEMVNILSGKEGK